MSNLKITDFNRMHDLTAEEVRLCPLFAHFTDEQAKEVIDTIKQFTLIVCDSYRRKSEKSLKEP